MSPLAASRARSRNRRTVARSISSAKGELLARESIVPRRLQQRSQHHIALLKEKMDKRSTRHGTTRLKTRREVIGAAYVTRRPGWRFSRNSRDAEHYCWNDIEPPPPRSELGDDLGMRARSARARDQAAVSPLARGLTKTA